MKTKKYITKCILIVLFVFSSLLASAEVVRVYPYRLTFCGKPTLIGNQEIQERYEKTRNFHQEILRTIEKKGSLSYIQEPNSRQWDNLVISGKARTIPINYPDSEGKIASKEKCDEYFAYRLNILKEAINENNANKNDPNYIPFDILNIAINDIEKSFVYGDNQYLDQLISQSFKYDPYVRYYIRKQIQNHLSIFKKNTKYD